MSNLLERQMIIGGPCALESKADMEATIAGAKQVGLAMVRANLWKPRTEPGFSGVGEKGMDWVAMALDEGLGLSMEVILPEHARAMMSLLTEERPNAQMILWLGSRNQNHLIQKQIAEIVARDKRITLMIKNQPWRDERHWVGIMKHAESGGLETPRMMLCHRGFTPWDADAVEERNVADLEMAQRVAEKTRIPMIMDPSHIGGNASLVKRLIVKYGSLPWVSGQLIEVHPDPTRARTDAGQQLTWNELGELIRAA